MRTDTVDESRQLTAWELQERALDGQVLLSCEERVSRSGERFWRYRYLRVAQHRLPPLTFMSLAPPRQGAGAPRA
jgi:hypothetical protein